jgi:hypothetical protein
MASAAASANIAMRRRSMRDRPGAAAQEDAEAEMPLGTRISSRFKGLGLTEEIPEIRNSPVRPISFDE